MELNQIVIIAVTAIIIKVSEELVKGTGTALRKILRSTADVAKPRIIIIRDWIVIILGLFMIALNGWFFFHLLFKTEPITRIEVAIIVMEIFLIGYWANKIVDVFLEWIMDARKHRDE